MTANPISPVRGWRVDGRPVQVFDGLMPNPAEYVQALELAAFTRTEVARRETAMYRHWVTEIKLDALAKQPILGVTLAAASLAANGAVFRPYRAYTNASNYGDVLFSHADCACGSGEFTALWYVCNEWSIDSGGETVFYDDDGEIACAVRPRPGRLVVFDGSIVHAGRPPGRTTFSTRFTLAIKLERMVSGT